MSEATGGLLLCLCLSESARICAAGRPESDTPKQIAHFLYACPLGNNDGVKDWNKLRAERKTQGVFRHFNGSPVVRDHFSHERGAEIIGYASISHISKHRLGDALKTPLIQAKFLPCAAKPAAAKQGRAHVGNAFGLRFNNV